MIALNYKDPRPIYEQIKFGLRRLIMTDVLQPNDKMPSVRELSAQLAINPNTVQRAYRELEAEGYIYSVPGKGSFVSPDCKPDAERMNALLERFTKVGGVGDMTAMSILAGLPEIGNLTDAKLNRLVGIAPEEKQSGTKEWQRRIWGGRKDVRNALYMACLASIQWNAVLGGYYRKKRAEGHPHKWAIVPTMRKLMSLLNRIARDPDFIPSPEPESTKRNATAGRKRKAA